MKIASSLLLLAFLWAPMHADAISAAGMLKKLRLVDGAGSGLDADTVQGLSPADIAAEAADEATDRVVDAIGSLLDSAYTQTATKQVPKDRCQSVDATCEDSDDFLLHCGGGTDPSTGYLTGVVELVGERVCRALGCGFGADTSLVATATCLDR
jgi:hypothetical protein